MPVKPSMRSTLSMMLGKIETQRGVDPLPNAIDDAFLVGDMDVTLDPTELERNVFRQSFSPIPNGVGRKIMNVSFSHEIKGSGDVGGTRPKLGTLLRACGMRERLITAGAANQIENPVRFGTVNGPRPTFAKTAAPTSRFGSYLVEVVAGGASGAARMQVTRWASGVEDLTVMPNTRHDARTNDSAGGTLTLDTTSLTSLVFSVGGTVAEGDTFYAIVGGVVFEYTAQSGDDDDAVAAALAALIDADSRLAASAATNTVTVTFTGAAASVVVTSGTTAITLGASGAQITPTWTGNLVRGQRWIVQLYETGYQYRPTSRASERETITLYVFRDGVLHKITSCTGTVTFTGEAGNLAQAQFEFQGNYIDPVEEPTPLDAVFEETIPPQVELAQMSINGDNDFCAQSFTFTLGNQINPRDCINATDGYDGSNITGREPTAQLNPEASYEAYTGMWGDFSRSKQFPIHLRVGSEAGNMVRFYAERVNFTGLTYGDRNNVVTLESTFRLNGVSAAGDDELRVVFS